MEAILSQLGSNSIDSPQGGATAASPFVCRNVGGSPPKQWNNDAAVASAAVKVAARSLVKYVGIHITSSGTKNPQQL